MIRLIGAKTIYVNLNETYEEPGVVAKTKSGKVLEYTKEITISDTGEIVSHINTSIENTTYVITYKTSNEEKEVSVTRNIVVLDMKPEITMTEGKETYVSVQEVLVTVSVVRPNTLTSFIVEVKKDGEVFSAETKEETEISKTITFTETGIYEVKVTVTDNNNHTSTMTRNYKIDNEAPEITFKEEITLKANEVAGFNLMEDETLSVTDNIEVTSLVVSGNLNFKEEYQDITYIAKDEAGNETRKTRTFHITPATGPVLNYDSAGSNGIWTKEQPIGLYAMIMIENDELTSFSYQVDNGTKVNVPITDNQQAAETIVTLNETGKHSIKIKAEGKYGNEKSETIGEFWIDVTPPTVGTIEGNTATWTADKTLTATLTDSDSKIKYYAFTKDATEPEKDSDEWKSVGENPTSPYHFSKPVTENGTYYLWAKDSAGNVSEVKSVVVNKIDAKVPELTVNNYSGKYGTDKLLSTLYAARFGDMGGTTTCKNGSNPITNVNAIKLAGTYNIKCTALGKNGKSTEKTIVLTLQPKTFTEVMEPLLGTSVANNDPDHNLRYVGKNPNNYVCFGKTGTPCDAEHLYRIIGLFNGEVKIIKATSIGNKAWDTNNKNNWGTASLKAELNGTYLDSIDITSKSYINEVHVWALGGWYISDIVRDDFYNYERGTEKYGDNPTDWTGAIGLMYPSDYAYATNGGSTCTSKTLYTWDQPDVKTECTNKSWLYDSSVSQWTLTPKNQVGNLVFTVYHLGNISGSENAGGNLPSSSNAVRPALYLKSTTKIKSGTGTSDDPYILTT